MNLAGIFAWDVDFVLDIREGDEFRLVYEELWRDGEPLDEGEILAAEFINQGESFRAIRFADPNGRVDYYTPEGRSVRKALSAHRCLSAGSAQTSIPGADTRN